MYSFGNDREKPTIERRGGPASWPVGHCGWNLDSMPIRAKYARRLCSMLLLSCPDMCSYDTDHSARIYKAADTFTASHTVLEFTGKVFISTPRTPDRRTHRCKFNTARGPLDPLHLYSSRTVRVFKGLGLACSIKTSVARSGDPVGMDGRRRNAARASASAIVTGWEAP